MANTARRANSGPAVDATHGFGTSAGGFHSALAYVPHVLAAALAASPDREPPWLDEVQGTLLMADVSGFTAMSELLAASGKEGAEWLTDIINSYFGSMLSTAKGHGGDIITFGGDAMLLLYTGPRHAQRACASALAMLDATERLPAFKVGTRRVRLGVSLGAHSGAFMLGSTGLAGSRLQCLLFGPGATRTCRAEAAAGTGELLVTRETVDALGGEGTAEERDGMFKIQGVRCAALSEDEVPVFADLASATEHLLPYLPPAVAATVAAGEPTHVIESDHRKVCVVFINVMGVDELLESDGPEAVVRDLQDYVSSVVRLSDQHGGYVISNDVYTLGLKLIVGFGAPVAHESDTANALRMVASLRHEAEAMGLRLTHRIGVNSGFVFAGDVGPAYRRQYTVMGDAVNLAARLMSAAGPGQVYVSSATLRESEAAFEVETLAPISVKGKKHPVPVCALVGECSVQEGPAQAGSALFGRDDELRALRQAADEAASGHGRVAVVCGEPGIGKSRLTQALRQTLSESSWEVLVGGCQAYTSGQPFAPWGAPLELLLGIASGDDPEQKALRVQATVRDLLPDSEPWIALLGPLLGASLVDTDAVRALAESERRARLFSLVAELLRARAARTPVALVVEDLHWADTSSLALLMHVVAETRDACVLVVATSRPVPAFAADLPSDAIRIDLEELPSSTAVRIVSDILGRLDLPEEMARILLRKARGNPLFLQEVARSLASSGTLDELLSASGSSLAEQMAALEIPDRVQGLVMARIDALPDAAKDVLRTAAVIGATFERSTLSGVLGAMSPGVLDDDIATIVAQSLADPEPSAPEPTYRFRHALIQEVAYDSLMFSKRRQLHRRTGEYLERAHSKDLEPVLESLVLHYSAGRDYEKTRFFAVRAAGKARRLFAHDEAVAYYRRGMGTVRARTPKAAALRSVLEELVGDTLEAAGRPAEAANAYKDALRRWERARRGLQGVTSIVSDEQVLGIAEDTPPKSREAALCRKIGFAYSRTYSDYDLSLEWLERAIAALPPGQPALRGQILVASSSSFFRKGEFEKSMTRARQGLELARRVGDRATRAYGLGLIASACFELGKLRQAIRYDSASLPLYIELDDLWGQGSANLNLGTSYALLAMLDKALDHFRMALDIWTRIGNVKETGLAHVNMAEALIMRGDYDLAIDHVTEALAVCGRTGTALWLQGFAQLNLARAYQGKGMLLEALEAVELSVACMEKAHTPGTLAEALLRRAELELRTNRPEKARDTCDSALEMLHALGMKYLESRGLRVRGLVSEALGDGLAAEESLRASVELANHVDAPYERGLGLLALAELYAKSDDPRLRGRPYRRLLRDATAALSKVGARVWVQRARELAGEPESA